MSHNKRSYVVLGGGGFLGINLCRRLAATGHRVRALGRHCLFPEALRGVEWHPGDFADVGRLTAAIESSDVVFHLIHSTTPHSSILDMAGDIQQNVVPSLALLDISRKLGIKRVVFVSSGGTIYGLAEQVPTPETAPTEPVTAYGITKLAIEKYLALHEYLYGLDFRVLRVTNPFGPYQVAVKNQGVIAALISRALSGERMEIWGDGSAVRDFIFVDDVVDALEAAAGDQGSARIFNIGSGEGRSLREVIATIERLLNQRLDITWNAQRSVDLPVSVVAIDRARERLGWTPKTTFETGLEKTIDWWREAISPAAYAATRATR
jgi:UDP-glucose 4-epimerase